MMVRISCTFFPLVILYIIQGYILIQTNSNSDNSTFIEYTYILIVTSTTRGYDDVRHNA